VVGSLEARDCTVTYRLAGRDLAKAFVGRDLEGLRAELAFEQTGRALGPAAAPASAEPSR
jgi:hypothetical protein